MCIEFVFVPYSRIITYLPEVAIPALHVSVCYTRNLQQGINKMGDNELVSRKLALMSYEHNIVDDIDVVQ